MNGKAMKNSIGILCIWGLLWAVCPCLAQEPQEQTRSAASGRNYPPEMSGCKQLTYKTIGETKLDLYVFSPERPTKAPAIVFFFGGGWQNGTPQQFEVQCRELAKRGMVAMTADYRVASRHGVKPTACVADARSAVRWIRAHADELGIDPDRIASAGGSAGGHIAACAALISTFDEPNEDRQVSACPNALVLFNPALVLAPIDGYDAKGFGTRVPENRLGTKPETISPAHHLVKEAPPTIIFHGKQDTTVPFDSAVAFTEIMTKLGNRCELKAYDGQSHGFFNNDRFKKETLDQTVAFLVSLGWLTPK